MAQARELSSKQEAAIRATALEVQLPDGVTDVACVSEGTVGERFTSGDFKGVGGSTKFGVAWVVRGREKSEPIALYDTPQEASVLFDLLTGPEGELWHRKERRKALIQELEAKESAEEAEAKATLKAANAGGAGSSRPKRSSGRRSARR